MHILEAALAANVLFRPQQRDARPVARSAVEPAQLGLRCLARAVAAIAGFGVFIMMLDRMA